MKTLHIITLICACQIAGSALAEKADRSKPINLEADKVTVDDRNKVHTYEGNVVLTQGTITVRADKLTFRQNPDNSMQVTATGNPVSFRQKRDGSDEYYEGFAQRIEYDGAKDLLELFDRALLKRGIDEIRSNYVSYNTKSEVFKAEGRPDTPAAVASDTGPGARVRGTFQPREGEGLAPKSAPKGDAKAAPKAPAAKSGAKATDRLELRSAGETAAK